MAVCPIGAIRMDNTGNILKCDLCGGEPYCAKYCPTGAIIYARPDKAFSRRRLSIAREYHPLTRRGNSRD
jgi:Fe-S-cluster-containing hydrogenase component 2